MEQEKIEQKKINQEQQKFNINFGNFFNIACILFGISAILPVLFQLYIALSISRVISGVSSVFSDISEQMPESYESALNNQFDPKDPVVFCCDKAMNSYNVLVANTALRDITKKIVDAGLTPKIYIYVDCLGGSASAVNNLRDMIKYLQDKYKAKVEVFIEKGYSGGYLAFTDADKITLVGHAGSIGSIGAIVDLLNCKQLYEYFKVVPYSLSTGKYKRNPVLTDDEDTQLVINQVLEVEMEKIKQQLIERGVEKDRVISILEGGVLTQDFALSSNLVDDLLSLREVEQYILSEYPDNNRIFFTDGTVACFTDSLPEGIDIVKRSHMETPTC